MAIEQSKISFITANFVGRALNYSLGPDWLTADWGKADRFTKKLFASDTFEEEFDKLMQIISEAGFKTIELWSAHLDYLEATQEKIQKAKQILKKYSISVCAYSTAGNPEKELEKSFLIAKQLGTDLINGGVAQELLGKAYQLCQKYRIRLAFENHPGKETPEKLKSLIGDKGDWFGATADTGWFGTSGIDAAEAIRELRKSVFHVHLKDVKASGKHETCTLGDGIVNIPAVIDALREISYSGYMGIEHESGDHDPMEEIKESLERLQCWLKE